MKKILLLALLLFAFQAGAQYPTKPVRLVIHFPVGGSTDLVARVLAQSMSESLGQPVIVENKLGAVGDRHPRRPDPRGVCDTDVDALAHQGRTPARLRGDDADAQPAIARGADDGRSRPAADQRRVLRGALRAGEDAAGDRGARVER